MTLLQGSSSADVGASVDRCWAIIADVDGWAQWTGGLDQVTVIERDDQGRVTVCDTVNDAKVTKVTVRVAITYDAPHRLSFTLVQSDKVKAMDGSWTLEEIGPDRTRARFDLALDPGHVGLLARPLERALRPLIVGRRADELAGVVSRLG
jgi:ribosome-associated toxin RatA of RatAB toxin-antitoxin module